VTWRGLVVALAIAGVLVSVVACEPAVEQVEGVLIHVDTQGLDAVEAFTLRTDEGRAIEFRVGVIENAAEFPPGHLAEHLANGQPIRVTYRREGSANVAFRLEDAPS
jgi:hypothetical protein